MECIRHYTTNTSALSYQTGELIDGLVICHSIDDKFKEESYNENTVVGFSLVESNGDNFKILVDTNANVDQICLEYSKNFTKTLYISAMFYGIFITMLTIDAVERDSVTYFNARSPAQTFFFILYIILLSSGIVISISVIAYLKVNTSMKYKSIQFVSLVVVVCNFMCM